jgi:hypothetical protein
MGLGLMRAGHSGGEGFAGFCRELDGALEAFIKSRGQEHGPLIEVYNRLWPDGHVAALGRERNGTFVAVFDDGRALHFRDWEELGAATLLMRDLELYERVRAEGPATVGVN